MRTFKTTPPATAHARNAQRAIRYHPFGRTMWKSTTTIATITKMFQPQWPFSASTLFEDVRLPKSTTVSFPRQARHQQTLVVLDTDRFVATQPIELKEDLSEVRFQLESESPAKHLAKLRLSFLTSAKYDVRGAGGPITAFDLHDGQEAVVEVPVNPGARPESFTITRHNSAKPK